MAGIIPGAVLAALFSAYIMWSCRNSKEYVREPWVPWPEKWRIVKSSLIGLMMPVLVLGLIYTGTVYVTEAAGIAVLYVLVACLIEGTIKWRDLIGILRESAKMTTMLFMMIIGSVVLGGMVSILGFTEKIVESVLAMHLSANMVVLMLMILLIILGTYLEPAAIMFLFVPMAAPLLKSLGVDLIWFGVLFAINMEMAIISPPVGTNMNVVQQISGVSYTEVNKGVIPFIFVMAAGLIVMGLFPQLSLWLPNLLMK
jgi:C4-dicarboxylate transporter DctM subunit